jgi:hypothetical protein
MVQVPVLLLVFAWCASPINGTQTTYNFVGACTDCTGNATAQLVLLNYPLGVDISAQPYYFVSLTYSSNLFNFTVLASDNPTVSGSLPVSLPASATISVQGPGNKYLFTGTNGSWCAGCELDHGTSGTWSLASSVPAMSAPALIGTGFVLAAMGIFLLKRARRRQVAA